MDTITADALTNSRITAAYREHTPGSADLAKEAGELFPSGITHDARNVDPYCVFIERAQGPHKWDVDGNRYVDYFGGHGALLLGHHHPVVTEAVRQAFFGVILGLAYPVLRARHLSDDRRTPLERPGRGHAAGQLAHPTTVRSHIAGIAEGQDA